MIANQSKIHNFHQALFRFRLIHSLFCYLILLFQWKLINKECERITCLFLNMLKLLLHVPAKHRSLEDTIAI